LKFSLFLAACRASKPRQHPRVNGEPGQVFAIRKGDLDFPDYLDSWIMVNELKGWLTEHKQYGSNLTTGLRKLIRTC
jgi:hypothetical protein